MINLKGNFILANLKANPILIIYGYLPFFFFALKAKCKVRAEPSPPKHVPKLTLAHTD